MNISLPDQEKISCKIHKNEHCVAADLNIKGKKDVNFLCIKCLIEQQLNQKITLIDDTKRLINQMKTQKLENQSKENEIRRETFKNILSQIKEFKLTVDTTFDKITTFVQQSLFYIQKDIEQSQYEGKNNYLEDLTELSELYSEDIVSNSKKLQDDNKIIEEIQKQFETLFSNPQYLQLNQTMKNTRSLITEGTQSSIVIQPIKQTNEKKTPCLNILCKIHKKEIIMFEIESNKETIQRFMCIDCMKDNPKKYKSIEDLNEEWITFNQEQDKILQKLKKKKLDQSSKLQIQITDMRKNFNQQLNDLEDSIVKEQIESNNTTNEIKKNNFTTIYELNNEDLIEAMQVLNKAQKTSPLDTRLIEYQMGKDQLYFQDVENKLEKLKQHNILDIQQALNILKDNINQSNEFKQLQEMITQLIKQQQHDQSNKANLEQINKDLNDFLRNSKQHDCLIEQFQNMVIFYKEYMQKLEPFRNKLLSLHQQQEDNDSVKLFDKHIQKLKDNSIHIERFCELEKYQEEIREEREITKQQEAEQNKKLKEIQEKLTEKQCDYFQSLTKQIKLENLIRSLKKQRTYLIQKNNADYLIETNNKLYNLNENYEETNNKLDKLIEKNKQFESCQNKEFSKIQDQISIIKLGVGIDYKKEQQLMIELRTPPPPPMPRLPNQSAHPPPPPPPLIKMEK